MTFKKYSPVESLGSSLMVDSKEEEGSFVVIKTRYQ